MNNRNDREGAEIEQASEIGQDVEMGRAPKAAGIEMRPEVDGRSELFVGSNSSRSAGPGRRRPALVLSAVLILGTFAAMPVRAAGPAAVDLRTAGDFVVLSKAGISTTGVTSITGDIGVSPISATAITGFGLILNPSNKYSTSSQVTGRVYAADYASPTPAKLTAAVGDMETAYADAAGRSLPDFTELYSGDLTGQTLTPGLYKWGTGVLISAGGVTLSGSPTAVWIFQIAQDLTVDSGAIMNLIGGANAANIFWQVAGQTTIGTTSQMKGIVLCATQIVMSTSATLNGRALAQTAVTLDANTISVPVVVDCLFCDDFETSDTSRWSDSVQ